MKVFQALDRARVIEEVSGWARLQRERDPGLLRVGLFGSYARDAHAPGSDIDLLLIVRESGEPRWFMRAAAFDTSDLSVGVDLFVYTEPEAARMRGTSAWFRHVLHEAVWM